MSTIKEEKYNVGDIIVSRSGSRYYKITKRYGKKISTDYFYSYDLVECDENGNNERKPITNFEIPDGYSLFKKGSSSRSRSRGPTGGGKKGKRTMRKKMHRRRRTSRV